MRQLYARVFSSTSTGLRTKPSLYQQWQAHYLKALRQPGSESSSSHDDVEHDQEEVEALKYAARRDWRGVIASIVTPCVQLASASADTNTSKSEGCTSAITTASAGEGVSKSGQQPRLTRTGRLRQAVQDAVELDKPLSYVLGTHAFYPLPQGLVVRAPTLIPRTETEHWVNELATHLTDAVASSSRTIRASGEERQKRVWRVLDIGTGTGCIALALAHTLEQALQTATDSSAHVVAIDKSESACELAMINAKRNGLALVSSQRDGSHAPPLSIVAADQASNRVDVCVEQVDLWSADDDILQRLVCDREHSALAGYDLIVSNPPYITRREYDVLDRSVKDWEDPLALLGELDREQVYASNGEVADEASAREAMDDDDDGLVFYRRIAHLLPRLARRSLEDAPSLPLVVFETGYEQAEAVAHILVTQTQGFITRTEVQSDQYGVARVVYGWQ